MLHWYSLSMQRYFSAIVLAVALVIEYVWYIFNVLERRLISFPKIVAWTCFPCIKIWCMFNKMFISEQSCDGVLCLSRLVELYLYVLKNEHLIWPSSAGWYFWKTLSATITSAVHFLDCRLILLMKNLLGAICDLHN